MELYKEELQPWQKHILENITLPLRFVYDDGGREEAGYRGRTGDCVVRACAIVTNQPYKSIYQHFKSKNSNRSSNYGHGVEHQRINEYLTHFGFGWTECRSEIGLPLVQGFDDSLPMGILVVNTHQHVSAVIDHIVHDTFDPACGGIKRIPVVGYWRKVV